MKLMFRNVLESQSPDFNPTEMLWKDLKQAVHMRKLTNITELKWFCTEGLKLLQDVVQDWPAVTRNFTCNNSCNMKVTPDTESKDSHWRFAMYRSVTMDHLYQ